MASDYENDPELKKLKNDFEATFQERAQKLNTAIAAKDFATLALESHRLAGIAETYGFSEISTLSIQIDEMFDATVEKTRKLVIALTRVPTK